MAYFYEDDKDQFPTWEEVGGFNARLLTELRAALMDVRGESRPAAIVQTAIHDWMRRNPMFDFPDDEIG